MLQAIRERAQGWIAWVIVVLISIPFALWGIQSYLGVGGEPIAAEVNGVEITERDLGRRVEQARGELRERLGASYDPSLFDQGELRDQVLDDLIAQALLLDVSERMGMRVSDDEIRLQILAEPAFQRDGRFDREAYQRLLQLQGMTPAQFEAQLRRQLVGNQLLRAVVGSELVTRAELSDYRRLSGQTRDLSYARIPVADFRDEGPVDEERIRAYYDANSARFQTPERVKLDYLVLDVDELAQGKAVDDEELRGLYEEERARFGQPEKRSARHLLLTLPPDADAATAEAVLGRIRTIRDRILNGESFADLARAESQDPGSATEGGSLGSFEQGVMDPAFDRAAFALPVGELSEPIRTRFGYHLLEVTDIQPASVKPFEEVKEELRAELSRQRGEGLYYDLGERLANLAYESPDSLQPVAEELGLEVRHSDWIGREGGEGLLAHPRVLSAVFSEEVLTRGANSDLIEPERDALRAIVLRVTDHQVAAARPLDEVRDEIVESLRRERAREAAVQAAREAADKVRAGAAWSDALPGRTVETSAAVERDSANVPVPVREAAFALPVPTSQAPSVGIAEFDDGDQAVIQVAAVTNADPISPDRQAEGSEAEMLAQVIGRTAYEAMLGDMESRARVERRPPDPGAGL